MLGGMTTDLRNRLGSLATTDEVISAIRDLLGGMTVELDATAMEDAIHAALDELPHAAAALVPPIVADGPEVGAPEVTRVAAMAGDGTAPPERRSAGGGTAVGLQVRIDAERVAERTSGRSPEPEAQTIDEPPRANPTTLSLRVTRAPRVTSRAPSDRAIDEDALALVALSSRHR